MLSSAVIVFREVFEIVLIIGIVLAATKTMPNRTKAITLGFAGGLLGAGLIALFTGEISAIAEGVGQEYFNAGILLTAAIFIGWTVLWMKKHARHMKKHFADVGHAVMEGKSPYLALSAIIALAILREGSEIVLFTYGMLASGMAPLMLISGSVLGLISGLAVGLMLYFGLINLSVRIFFQVTSWMLVFLVAGMISQAFGFLVAAGAFENLARTVWDSSFILNEHGLIGQSLGTMIGYTAQPTEIQLIVYISTLIAMIGLMKMIDKNITFGAFFKTTSAVAILLAVFASTAHATDTVSSPYVEKGELELEWRGGLTNDDDNAAQDGAWKQKAVIGYGLTDRVAIEAKGEFEQEGNTNETDFSSLTLETKLQLTERGQYWLDAGVKGEYEINMLGGPDKIEAKLLLAKDSGKFGHKANLSLEHEVGDDAADETEAGFAWSSRYRYSKGFEPGFEWYSDFGSISDSSDFDEQKHKVGPVFYGKLGSVKYDVGYLVGVSDAAADGMFKAILEYEIPLHSGHH